MTAKFIKVKYSFEGEEVKTINVDRVSTISDFVELIREELENSDINCVYLKGRKLDEDELLINYVEDASTDVFIFSDDPDKKAEDFPDIDLADKKAEKKPKKTDAGSKSDDNPEDDEEDEFKIYTTATSKSLLEGDTITLQLSDNYDKITKKVKSMVKKWKVPGMPDDFETQIFLPGGVPFLPGPDPSKSTLDSYYDSAKVSRNVLYVVVTKKLGDFVYKKVKEPCNCSGDFKNMISPLFESTTAGLTQMASFLGYCYHSGLNAEHLLLLFAKLTRFAPLVVNVYRLLEHADLNALNIIAITGPLLTLFKTLSPDTENKKIFQNTIKMISYISLTEGAEYLNLKTIDYETIGEVNEDTICDYLRTYNHQKHIVIWEKDTEKEAFKGFDLATPDIDVTSKEIYEITKTYKPVAPLSLRFIHYPTFVKGEKKDEVILFLNEDKDDMVNIIDPKTGKVTQTTVDNLAKKLGNEKEKDFLSFIDGSIVEQIIVICFDESRSMKNDIDGKTIKSDTKDLSREQIAVRMLQSFVKQSNRFRVSSIYGLISFGNKVKVLQQMTAMSSKFVDQLKEIKPEGRTLLYDALKKAQDMILEITSAGDDDDDDDDDSDDSDGDKTGDIELPYPNAKARVIVISDGADNKSEVSPVALANSFIEHGIVVDTVIISNIDKNKEMCALSKLTGGLCFHPKDLNEGLKIFEQEAFLNINMRHVDPCFTGTVTDKILQEKAAKFNEKYDKEAENQLIIKSKINIPLATPLYMNYLYKKERKINTIRLRRALKELNIIGFHPSKDYVVLSSFATPDEWRIFIKGPKGTPFQNKWLNIFMSLPSKFPTEPPSFRFLTIPFHPNVSMEGTIVFSKIDSKYSPDVGIDSLINEIIKLLKTPEVDSAINREALKLFNDDKDKFKEQQKKKDIGKDSYKDFLKGVKIYEDVPDDEDIDEISRTNQIYVTNTHKTKRKLIGNQDDPELYD